MPFAKGKVSNPKGRPKRQATVPEMVRNLSQNGGADRWIALAVLESLQTGYLKLKDVDIGRHVDGYELTIQDWQWFLKWVWPGFKDNPALDEIDRPAKITVELGKTGTDG